MMEPLLFALIVIVWFGLDAIIKKLDRILNLLGEKEQA